MKLRATTAARSKPSPPRRARLHLLLGALALLASSLQPALAAPLLGAACDLAALPPDAQDAALARLADSGAASVELLLDWNRVQPAPGRFIWQADDAAVDAALAHGLEVVLVLGPCAEWAVDPAWEVPADQRRCSLPRSLDLWERYVGQAVGHFRGRVLHWQVRTHPTAQNFRGTRTEYLRLLEAAAQQARAADPGSLIIAPEAGSLDLAALDQLLSSRACQSCDVLGVYLPSEDQCLSRTALSWAVLTDEVLGRAEPRQRRPLWVLGADAAMTDDQWIAHYLLAWAFGAARCYLPAEAIEPQWVRPLSQLRYLGWLRLGPELWALVFQGPDGPVVVAWSLQQTELPASDLAPVADPELLKQAEVLGQPLGSAIAGEGESLTLRLGPRPALVRGLAPELGQRVGPPTRRAVLAARPGPDLGRLPLVYADYSLARQPEFGLYNRPLRGLPGGAITEELRAGRTCLRTWMTYDTGEEEMDNPWIYFDVDDAWLYFDRGQTQVTITIECEGSLVGEEKLGFNIRYDATAGYRFTGWQWVDPGYQWQSYRCELDDVNFANREGYDFCLNVKGSKQDLWVAAVIVEKSPTRQFASSPQDQPSGR